MFMASSTIIFGQNENKPPKATVSIARQLKRTYLLLKKSMTDNT